MKIKIEEHLIKMKSTKFLSELNLDLNSNISLKSYSINDLEHDKFIWLEVANLSVYLYIEYEFFRQFYFPNRYESQIYEDRLKKLGYKQNNGIWKIDRIPNKQCIIENIFYSYIYMFLFKEKKIELDNENTSCVTDSLLMGNVAQHENLSENTVILYRNLTEMIDMEIQTESENIQQKGKKIQVGQTQLYGIVNSSCQIECRNRMLNKILQVGSPRLDYDWEVACQTGQIVKENQSQTDQFQYGNSLDGKLMKNKKLQVGNPQIDNRVEVECQVESTMCDVETETFLKYNNRIKTEINESSSSIIGDVVDGSIQFDGMERSQSILSKKSLKLQAGVSRLNMYPTGCIDESSFEASNENVFIKPVDNKHKWTCIKCTFNNGISVDLCEMCLATNKGKPKENPIKLKNNISQKSERKSIFSNIGGGSNYEKSDNLTIYKVDKTQIEISESIKSLSKRDRNSGEVNQRKPGNKKHIPPVNIDKNY